MRWSDIDCIALTMRDVKFSVYDVTVGKYGGIALTMRDVKQDKGFVYLVQDERIALTMRDVKLKGIYIFAGRQGVLP